MQVGDLIKWTPEEDLGYHPVYGVVTEVDQYYFEVSWMDGDSGYYSVSAIGKGMEVVCK